MVILLFFQWNHRFALQLLYNVRSQEMYRVGLLKIQESFSFCYYLCGYSHFLSVKSKVRPTVAQKSKQSVKVTSKS